MASTESVDKTLKNYSKRRGTAMNRNKRSLESLPVEPLLLRAEQASGMREQDFIEANERLCRRQAAIKTDRMRTGPVQIGCVVPAVLDRIRRQAMRRKGVRA